MSRPTKVEERLREIRLMAAMDEPQDWTGGDAAFLLDLLDATRAQRDELLALSAELLAALEGIADSNGEGPGGECDEWTEAEAFHAVKRLAAAAIARARGGK